MSVLILHPREIPGPCYFIKLAVPGSFSIYVVASAGVQQYHICKLSSALSTTMHEISFIMLVSYVCMCCIPYNISKYIPVPGTVCIIRIRVRKHNIRPVDTTVTSVSVRTQNKGIDLLTDQCYVM